MAHHHVCPWWIGYLLISPLRRLWQDPARLLAPHGWLVTVGALGLQPLTLPNGPMIFGELRCAGFWVSRWYERADAATLARMRTETGALLRSGALTLPVAATFPLAEAVAALAHSGPGRVLFDCA